MSNSDIKDELHELANRWEARAETLRDKAANIRPTRLTLSEQRAKLEGGASYLDEAASDLRLLLERIKRNP